MAKYRTKPAIIDAIQFDGTAKGATDIFAEFKIPWARFVDDHIILQTFEGDLVVQSGDWIIKGIQGEYFTCKPYAFDRTYESYTPT